MQNFILVTNILELLNQKVLGLIGLMHHELMGKKIVYDLGTILLM
jgi:hypothetical protein